MSHNFEYNKDNVILAKNLRKNMTDEEKKLWYQFLSLLPIRVHRQKNIGDYIVDFYIPKYQIAIELDGSQHTSEEGKTYDAVRDNFLKSKGVSVIRYDNRLINESFSGVVSDIIRRLGLDEQEIYSYMDRERIRRAVKKS